jgi:methyltransferase (TIGR00027 family)
MCSRASVRPPLVPDHRGYGAFDSFVVVAAVSAYWIAAVRARETRRTDQLFSDPFAEKLAGERGFATMMASERQTGGENVTIPVRVRWFDDVTNDAVTAGIRQVVVAGAGLDTRPYRLDVPPDVDRYELDRPEVLADKESVLDGTIPAVGGTSWRSTCPATGRPRC